MEYIYQTTQFHFRNTIVSLGKFDGVHRGHRMLLDYMRSRQEEGLQAVAFTFSAPPGSVLNGQSIKVIYTEEEKRILMEQAGVDVMISYPFTKETGHMEAERFVQKVLAEKLDAKVIVTGKDFCFGYKRKGNVELLRRMSDLYGFEVVAFEKLSLNKKAISSTRIREHIKNGEVDTAAHLLGQPYFIYGRVVYGNQIGRTLGMPTANLCPKESKLLVPNGVYVTRSFIDNQWYPGITNIGYRPTVGGEKQIWVETYLFDVNRNLYDKNMMVEVLFHVRDEKKFSSLDELKAQMVRDMDYGKMYFAGRKNE